MSLSKVINASANELSDRLRKKITESTSHTDMSNREQVGVKYQEVNCGKRVIQTSKKSGVICIYDSVENHDIISASKVRRTFGAGGETVLLQQKSEVSAENISRRVRPLCTW